MSGQRLKQHSTSTVPLGIDLQRWGRLVTLFRALHDFCSVLVWSAGREDGASQADGRERKSEMKRGRVRHPGTYTTAPKHQSVTQRITGTDRDR